MNVYQYLQRRTPRFVRRCFLFCTSRKKVWIAATCFLFTACAWDKAELMLSCENLDVHYARDVQPIIAGSCSVTGCHNAGSLTGDFTTYAGLKTKVDNGSFRLRVLDLKIMPPVSQPPLTEKQLKQLLCWIEAGAPEN